ncbi:Haloacid dehalogenase-like hydrolase-domain-containing protein [Camillea tinctor]|nr:Haloacid dehalogenase-like hydrolase-domain-containing protein [Camillea tinctor]
MQALLPRATSGCAPSLGSSVSRTLRSRPQIRPAPARAYSVAPSSRHRPQVPHASCRPQAFPLGARAYTRVKPPPFAFAFDIDGVLLHAAKPIPGAREVFEFLGRNNVPFILLTNGGSKPTDRRQGELRELLGIPPRANYLVQSHTPFKLLAQSPLSAAGAELFPGAESLRDKNVLVFGPDAEDMRAIAHEYGFRRVLTTADILAADPTIFPFAPSPLMEKERQAAAALARSRGPPSGEGAGGKLKIDAMFVLNDPRDWALTTQIIVDLLLSERGVLGTYSARNGRPDLPRHGWLSDAQPRLYFSNPDLLWAAAHPLPRLGQGAFHAALAGIWARITDGEAELECKVIGKPSWETYRFAEDVLCAQRAHMGEEGEGASGGAVYMVGDNPESDVCGANRFKKTATRGARWHSALVRTGVWRPEHGPPKYEPDVIVDDVRAAVEWALEREGWKGGLGA